MVKALNRRHYSYAFLLPALAIYGGLFLLPTLSSLFFSLTRWTLTAWYYTGLDNFAMFFTEPSLSIGFTNTLVYAVLTCLLKVVLGLLLGMFLSSGIRTQGYLRSVVFFPNLLSTIAVGITFSSLMHPTRGVINKALSLAGITGPDWLGNVHIALLSIVLVDVWKGVGVATVIYIAGIMSIPRQYYEALSIDGGNGWNRFRSITLPLVRPAMNSVIILAFIGGLRTFDLVWVMTKGGPGFTTDLIASIIYKQYTGGFYGLATAGNVILFVVVSILALPLYRFLTRHEVDL
jgi:raffinose/stachyose/melibiose transport system permease protein